MKNLTFLKHESVKKIIKHSQNLYRQTLKKLNRAETSIPLTEDRIKKSKQQIASSYEKLKKNFLS